MIMITMIMGKQKIKMKKKATICNDDDDDNEYDYEQWRIQRGQIRSWTSPSSMIIDFSPLQRRNKREILGTVGNILNCPQANVWIRKKDDDEKGEGGGDDEDKGDDNDHDDYEELQMMLMWYTRNRRLCHLHLQ